MSSQLGRQPTAIWGSALDLNSPLQVSAHHYSRALADRGWKVAFVSFPVSPMHVALIRSEDTRRRFSNWWKNDPDPGATLFDVVPFSLLPPLSLPILRSSWVLKNWWRLTIPNVVRVLIAHGFDRPDLFVLDSLHQSYILEQLQPANTLMRITDDISGFSWATPQVIEHERELMGRVDHVVYTASVMKDRIAAANPRVMTHVPNGADVRHFLDSTQMCPDEYDTIPRPRAVYVGAIADWFDVGLIAEAARSRPNLSFVLVGPVSTTIDPLRSLPNVYLTGKRSYQQVPSYLRHADVGMIPFLNNDLVRSVNPIKLYEYLACGLPVVATDWEELRLLNSPARLCATTAEFVRALDETLVAPGDSKSRMEFASGADWRARFELLAKAVDLPTIEAAAGEGL